ncbi:MAG: ZIP family metal transporter [archaeon]
MMLVYIFLSLAVLSIISLGGALAIMFRKNDSILHLLVSFAAGTMLAAAFLDLIPESIEEGLGNIFYLVLAGFLFFFMLEKFFHWRHCHEDNCKEHPFTYLSLMGDGIHNFFDGIIIAVSYLSSIPLGIATTIAVIAHEIPQELGDFAVLIHGGFTTRKAILWNFIISLTAFLGALIVYFASGIGAFFVFLLPVAAGGFIYIAASDLIPEMHKEKRIGKSMLQILFFAFGILLISILIRFLET